jgi:hypothetical protein
MKKVDAENLKWFKEVVDKHGWPGKSMVGTDGALAAFLIAQHSSDLKFQKKCLGLIEKAYKAGEVEGQHLALITDRQRVLVQKKKQLYGTQLEARDGKLVPLPIEDEANVDKRRKELGMTTLAEYVKFVNQPPKPSTKKSTDK